jgi:outer membrane protein insertion porin family
MLASADLMAQDEFKITDPTLNPPREYEILDVQVEGNELARESYIYSVSSLRKGEKIIVPGEEIANAIKRLFDSGLFSDVKILVTERSSRGVKLLIRVTEKPRLFKYEIKGVKRSQRRDLEELIKLVPGVALTESNINRALNTIRRFYREKGLWGTEIETSQRPAKQATDRVILTFDIFAGHKYEIKDINFIGNELVTDKKLLKNIKPLKEDRRFKFFTKKLFKQADLDEGIENIIAYYRKNGFRDAYVVRDSVYLYNYIKDLTGVKVDIEIYEGPQYKVRNIEWDGNTVYTDEQLTQSLDFEKGDIFNEEKFEQNLNFNKTDSDINSLYQNIGYLFFQVRPTIKVVGEDSLDITFDIFEDEKATIRQVNFSGNTKTHDEVVRRSLRTVPGNTYSRSALVRTIRELGTLGFFNPEKINPELIPNPQDRTVDVEFQLEESQSTDNFEFSGGFGGRGIGVILSARVNFNNFSLQRMFEKGGWNPIPSGDGQRLSLGVQVTGTGFQSYSVGFTEPWLRGRPTSFGVNMSYNIINLRGSTERNELLNTSVSVGKRLKWPDDFFQTQTTLSYQLYDIFGATFLAEGTTSILSVQQALLRNSLDNPISPTNGSKFIASLEVAPPLSGFSEFYKIKTGYQYHVPLTRKLIFTSSVDYGFIGYFTEDKRSDFQRFFVGGTQLQQRQAFVNDNIDLRGFPGGINGTIAPQIDGEQVGGQAFTKYTFEMRYPAINNEQLQLIPYAFFDAGNSYLNFQRFDPFNVKRATGFGTRIFLPILGLVDLSYGYRLDGIDGVNGVQAGQWEFLFNIGAPF